MCGRIGMVRRLPVVAKLCERGFADLILASGLAYLIHRTMCRVCVAFRLFIQRACSHEHCVYTSYV